MGKVVTFGEIMLRLKSPALERFFQSPSLEATFGGGEANVAVSLANYGMNTAFVTALPNNAIGEACLREVRGFGVDVSDIKMVDGRMGIYFLETGSNQRPSKVIYDRADSCIAKAPVDLFDWKEILKDATWFHVTGITPAISQSAADLTLAAVKAAKEMGVKGSCDLNYRKNLWKYGKEAKEVMSEITKYVDVAIANEEDFQKSLGISAKSDVEITFNDVKLSNKVFDGKFYKNRTINLSGTAKEEGKAIIGWRVTGAMNKEYQGSELTLNMTNGTLNINPIIGNATGIDNVEQNLNSQQSTVYDLMGNKVTTPQAGRIYIQNGKKIIWR